MSRPKSTYGLFKVSRGETGYSVDGDAIEKFVELKDAHRALSARRDLAKTESQDPYQFAVLPLGPKGEGLLGPGV